MADENELGLSTPVSDGMLLAALRLLVKRPQWRLRLSTLDAGVGTQPEKKNLWWAAQTLLRERGMDIGLMFK